MSISVNSILDAGLLVHGKLPDIYWELDLTGSEMKVLRYVYNNCLRLYKNVKIFPRGKDGSPRFWRGKERMADDCGLSYTGFRNTVKHLFEKGLVTSMDGETEETLYCVGLSSTFLDNYTVSNQTVKNLRLHSLKDLISLIYDLTTLEIVENIKDLDKFPLITNVIKLTESQGIECFSETEENCDDNQTHKKTKITRKPIIVGRTPIMILPESIRLQSAQQKLKLLQNVRTPYEKKVLEIASYYEFKCRQVIHSTGFKCLGKDFRNHKNWKFLERIYNLCKDRDWDYKIYVDAQFDRVKYWQHGQLYPYLNQFASQGAIKYYDNYIRDYKEKHSITGDMKVKSEKVKSVNQQIIDEVIKDCEGMLEYIEKAKKRRNNRGLSDQQLKILYLSDHWMGLSVSYLASIPWFMTYLEQFPEETFLIELKQEIQSVKSNKKLLQLTIDIVGKVEHQMGIPETLVL